MAIVRLKNTGKLIGLYEIISGSLGFGIMLFQNLETNGFFLWTFILRLVMLTFFGLTIYAGWSLIKLNKDKIIYSEISQLIQLPIIGFGSFYYALPLGITFYTGLDYTDTLSYQLDLELVPSYFGIGIFDDISSAYIFINLIPLVILIFLGKLKAELS
ncbi:hypothetical protein [Owenweeksia hongkongensis]|uniref:hypothetical protein n=1 Tax=Owenweeksia hongkongensis TaxID=253245 RepID=UPI003A904A4D